MAGNTASPGASITGRVLAILDAFDSRHRELRLSNIARRADLVPPTGAKGLNLAIADVALLAPALAALLHHNDPRLADAYSDTALRRVWRCTHFS